MRYYETRKNKLGQNVCVVLCDITILLFRTTLDGGITYNSTRRIDETQLVNNNEDYEKINTATY